MESNFIMRSQSLDEWKFILIKMLDAVHSLWVKRFRQLGEKIATSISFLIITKSICSLAQLYWILEIKEKKFFSKHLPNYRS